MGCANDKPKESAVGVEREQEYAQIRFEAKGSLGVGLDFVSGLISDVRFGGVAHEKGVKAGWRIVAMNTAPISEELFDQVMGGGCGPWADIVFQTQERKVINLKPGRVGIDFDDDGFVIEVKNGQAKEQGVQEGWRICTIDDGNYECELLQEKAKGSQPYELVFSMYEDSGTSQPDPYLARLAEDSNTGNAGGGGPTVVVAVGANQQGGGQAQEQPPGPDKWITHCSHCKNQGSSANPCGFCNRDWRFAPSDPEELLRQQHCKWCGGNGKLGGCSHCGLNTSFFADPSSRPGGACPFCNGRGKLGGCHNCGLDTSIFADAETRVGVCDWCKGNGKLGGCAHCGLDSSIFADPSERPGFVCGRCDGKGRLGGCPVCGLNTSKFADASERPDSKCAFCNGKGRPGGCSHCGLNTSSLLKQGFGASSNQATGGKFGQGSHFTGIGAGNTGATGTKIEPTTSKLAPTTSKLAPTTSKITPTTSKITPTTSKIKPTTSKFGKK